MTEEEGNAAEKAGKNAAKGAAKAASTAVPALKVGLLALKFFKGCGEFFGCSSRTACLLLTFLGLPGFIVGVLANMGVL